MDRLPPEIYDLIVSFIERRQGEENRGAVAHRDLPLNYPTIATISRRFQAAIERRTFRVLDLTTYTSELDEFERILTPERRDYLKTLRVTIHVPFNIRTPPIEYEKDNIRRVNSMVITRSMRQLFNIIATINQDNHMPPRINFDIRISDPPYYNPRDLVRSYSFSMIDLTSDAADFPSLPAVRSFTINNCYRIWHPRIASLLTAKMTNVIHVDWRTWFNKSSWGRYFRFDQIYRDGLVDAIRSTPLPASTKSFSCSFHPSNGHTAQKIPNFIGTENYDPVSCALRHLTRNCTSVTVKGPIHASFFDPPADVLGGDADCWKNLSDLTVNVKMKGPDGAWLFRQEDGSSTPDSPGSPTDHYRLPPGFGQTEEEDKEAQEYLDKHFQSFFGQGGEWPIPRSIPNDAAMNTLLTAMARGCSRLPNLQEFIFSARCDHNENWPFQVCFVASSHSFGSWDTIAAHGTGEWRVYMHMNRWRPTEATLEELRMIGRIRDGRDSEVCFLPWGIFVDFMLVC
ncbi:uncharacterized protein GGS22DRAFT_169308 [Annulohypoxylon maeteangense]|uniref:uncharacterized protein n=1 Tax=Annulohypoxylon maeteangense TaxID=1927788 RepID=UPI0020079F24|nr:uncharacterized protein GGS22DRAFT_169308 [Annulohypoxylon maeteangense]KAI0882405.1 hypothetical protein GGS22DRAFT_169308 [Annulohypoxylon maeteangense]